VILYCNGKASNVFYLQTTSLYQISEAISIFPRNTLLQQRASTTIQEEACSLCYSSICPDYDDDGFMKLHTITYTAHATLPH
jgi:hypothetical protein